MTTNDDDEPPGLERDCNYGEFIDIIDEIDEIKDVTIVSNYEEFNITIDKLTYNYFPFNYIGSIPILYKFLEKVKKINTYNLYIKPSILLNEHYSNKYLFKILEYISNECVIINYKNEEEEKELLKYDKYGDNFFFKKENNKEIKYDEFYLLQFKNQQKCAHLRC
jgi:hypothetical protein